VTDLAGPLPKTPNQFLSGAGERGVQIKYLTPGTYFLNPFAQSVDLVTCNRGERYRRCFVSLLDGFPSTLNCSVEWYIPKNTPRWLL
jgi:hypothetical protein